MDPQVARKLTADVARARADASLVTATAEPAP
jgi:hypothetical protein